MQRPKQGHCELAWFLDCRNVLNRAAYLAEPRNKFETQEAVSKWLQASPMRRRMAEVNQRWTKRIRQQAFKGESKWQYTI
jgi:hypothetical protein